MFLLRHTHTHTCIAHNAIVGYTMCSISGIGAWSVSEWYAFNLICIIGHCTVIVVEIFSPFWSRLTYNFWESFSPNEPKLSEWVNDSLQLNRLQFRFKQTKKIMAFDHWRKWTEIPLASFDTLTQHCNRCPHKVQSNINVCAWAFWQKLAIRSHIHLFQYKSK